MGLKMTRHTIVVPPPKKHVKVPDHSRTRRVAPKKGKGSPYKREKVRKHDHQ